MSVQTEIDRIITAVGAAYDAVEAKGGTLPTSETVANLAEAINSIPKDTHQAVEQATPSLTLNAATGEVTAEATQAAGLVAAGTKKATMQLATQAAKTVTPSAAQQTAVASGKYTTGNVVVAAVPTEAKTVELSMPSGNQTVSPSSGKFLSEVTVKKPATMLPENIKKGVSIGGVVGTLESGGGSTSETWVLKAELAIPDDHVSYPVDATMYSNNYQRDVNVVQIDMASEHLTFFVLNDDNNRDSVNGYAYGEWYDNSYRKLVFNVPPTGDLLTWLTANGVKQPANLAVQPSKNVTVTSNGTTEITPDAPYDVMEKANVTVNVASVSTVTINCDASDTSACYLDPSGMWHTADKLNRGANEILVAQKTPIFIYNIYGYSLDSLVNLTYSGAEIYIVIHTGTATIGPNPYKIYYATDAEASAHMQTD